MPIIPLLSVDQQRLHGPVQAWEPLSWVVFPPTTCQLSPLCCITCSEQLPAWTKASVECAEHGPEGHECCSQLSPLSHKGRSCGEGALGDNEGRCRREALWPQVHGAIGMGGCLSVGSELPKGRCCGIEGGVGAAEGRCRKEVPCWPQLHLPSSSVAWRHPAGRQLLVQVVCMQKSGPWTKESGLQYRLSDRRDFQPQAERENSAACAEDHTSTRPLHNTEPSHRVFFVKQSTSEVT